jgi:hypothetical protein
MSTAESWDLVVPEDDAALGAEVRRHIGSLKPGQRVRVTIGQAPGTVVVNSATGRLVASQPVDDDADLPFIGSVSGGPRDLASRTDDYLAQGFGRD